MDDSSAFTLLVGRNHELETLRQALQSAGHASGSCCLIAGEAGIGKSRLTRELRRQAAVEGFTVLSGDCFEQNISYPYSAWLDALRAFFALHAPAEIQELLGPLAPEFLKLLPELSLLLPDISPAQPLDPLAEKYRLFEAFAHFCGKLMDSHPVLFILEDLHWSDALTLELMQFVARRFRARPLMLLGTYRSDEPSADLLRHLSELTRERLAHEILLGPLGSEEVEQLARALLPTPHPVPARLVQTLLALSEGNPFFLEEIVKSWVQEGRVESLLQQTAGDLRVPRSIQQMVQQRVGQLHEPAQSILVHASVIGPRFSYALLQEASGYGEQQLLLALHEAMDGHLLTQESADVFAFGHALIREAIYGGVLLRERRLMHKAFGELLERGGAAGPAELAYHFWHGEVWQKAMEYSQRAGEQAQTLSAPHEAITHFSRALEAAHRLALTPACACLRGRAQAYELLGEFERARADYEAVLDLAQQAPDRAAEWQALIDLGFLWQSRDWTRTGVYFQRAYALARSLEEAPLLAQSLKHTGYWRATGGQLREALSEHQQARGLFRELNDQRGLAQTLELLGLDSYAVGETVQGAAYCEEAVTILRELGDRQGLVNTLTNLSLRVRFDTEVMGDVSLVGLVGFSEQALEIARSSHYRVGEAAALHEAAACLCRAGEFGRGSEYLRRALDIAEETEHRELLASVHHVWGSEFYGPLLAFGEARKHLAAARTAAQGRGTIATTLLTTAHLASVCIQQSDRAEAQALLHEVLEPEVPDLDGTSVWLRACWAARAELELAEGSAARALAIVDRLLASTANLGEYGTGAVPRLSLLRAQALAALRQPDAAIAELEASRAVVEKQGQRALVWRLEAQLGRAYLAAGRRADAERGFSTARTAIQQLADSLPAGTLHDNFLKRALAKLPPTRSPTARRAAMQEFAGLTERERQVAALIAEGRSNREIAEALVITVRTVESHTTRILDRLGFKSRSEIAAWAVAKGLAHPLR